MTRQPDKQHQQFSSFIEFKKYRSQISEDICCRLFKILQGYNQHKLKPNNLIKISNLILEIEEISKKLKAHKFRISIIGEFSRGKSTLVNALVGESIQPVRAIAGSATIAVLRYGLQKRIVCYYKDGRTKEILFDEYQNLASISKEAALKYRSEELARSPIEEIIFEHPNLDFCINGVEIVDSPGLNEHPERAAITQRLLKNTDAIIFLTFASALLSETERKLIYDLKVKLCDNKQNKPANNLFIVVNKMDELDSEEDYKDIQDLVEEFALGEIPVVADNDRIHFISAKAALKAILEKNQNEYTKSFEKFTKSVENFLTYEHGFLGIHRVTNRVKEIVETGLEILKEYEEDLNSQIQESQLEKQRLIERIGELSGHKVRVCNLVGKWTQKHTYQLSKDIDESWNKWVKGEALKSRLKERSECWESGGDACWNQKKIVEDYIDSFIDDLSKEVNIWIDENVKNKLETEIKTLDKKIHCELKAIESNFFDRVYYFNKYYFNEYDKSFEKESFDFDVTKKSWYGNLIDWIGGLLIVGYVFGSGDHIRNEISKEVFKVGTAKFFKQSDEHLTDIKENIPMFFQTRINFVDKRIASAVSSYDSLSEKQEEKHKDLLEKYKSEKGWIDQQRQQLAQVQNKIEAILK